MALVPSGTADRVAGRCTTFAESGSGVVSVCAGRSVTWSAGSVVGWEMTAPSMRCDRFPKMANDAARRSWWCAWTCGRCMPNSCAIMRELPRSIRRKQRAAGVKTISRMRSKAGYTCVEGSSCPWANRSRACLLAPNQFFFHIAFTERPAAFPPTWAPNDAISEWIPCGSGLLFAPKHICRV